MNLETYLRSRGPLRNINRFQMEFTIKKQNLCEHGYSVGCLFYLICKMADIAITTEDLFLAMNHDFIESLTGDLNQIVKGKNEETEKAWVTIEDSVSTSETKKFTDAQAERSLGKRKLEILKLADALEAYLYTTEELRLGNTALLSANRYYENKVKMSPAKISGEVLVTVQKIYYGEF